MKNDNSNKAKVSRKKRTIAVVAVIFVLLCIVIGASSSASKTTLDNTVQPGSQSDTKQPIELKDTTKIEVKTVTEDQPLPYTSSVVDDSSIDAGVTVTRTAGVNGVTEKTYEVTYSGGKEINRAETGSHITQAAINEVIAHGTKQKQQSNCDPNYTPCIQYVSYDLDCKDIRQEVRVIGTDHYRLDADHDGWGCESYR